MKEKILNLINHYWKFNDNQYPMSSWHDKQDLLNEVEKAFEKPLPTDEKTVCPECLKKCTNEELKMFGGLCEECSVDFN